jgi:hypothetical protein
MQEDEIMGFGSEEEWKRFNKQFPVFVEKYPAIEAVRDKVFHRKSEGTLFDVAMFAFGRVCSEDFQQAFILCGNGFGIGALQLVRGMYERHVTAAYLLKHPDQLDRFLEYDKVQRGKGLIHFSFVYEAGPTGFGLHDELVAAGHVCLVVAPSGAATV